MLIIAGGIRLKDPFDLNEFVADARKSIPAARASDGNITFTYMVEDPVAGDAFMFERWRDESAPGLSVSSGSRRTLCKMGSSHRKRCEEIRCLKREVATRLLIGRRVISMRSILASRTDVDFSRRDRHSGLY